MKPLKCPNCNSSFSEQYMLNSHIKHVHSEKKLHCMTCDYKTNKNSHLKRHILTHEAKEEPPAKKIKCDQCSQIFSNKFNLDRHVKNVHGEEMSCPQLYNKNTTNFYQPYE